MHLTDMLDTSERLICKGIEEINKRPDLDPKSLEMIGQAVDVLKDICEIKKYENGGGYERYSRYENDGYEMRRRERYPDYEGRDRRGGDWESYRRM